MADAEDPTKAPASDPTPQPTADPVEECAPVAMCAIWLARRGYPDLALEMRDDFLRGWQVEAATWNAACETLGKYYTRTSDSPEETLARLAVRVAVPKTQETGAEQPC